MRALLNDQGVEWAFQDAIAGSTLASALPCYDQRRRLQLLGYDMRRNEIACFLSHRNAWKACVQAGRPALVLEDDVQLGEGIAQFAQLVPLVHELIDYLGERTLVRLGNGRFRQQCVPLHPLGQGVQLVRFKGDPLSAFAYVLTPHVATKLLQASETFFVPVDDFLWRGWDHGCTMLDLSRDVLFTSDDDNSSTIGDRSKPPLSLWQKAKREYYRSLDKREKTRYEAQVLQSIQNCR